MIDHVGTIKQLFAKDCPTNKVCTNSLKKKKYLKLEREVALDMTFTKTK